MLINNDNIQALKEIKDNTIDSVVTDPPYGWSFMGKSWDYDVPSKELWLEVFRVLKPGGHLLSFGGSRTYHRLAVGIEDAGFEIRDMIAWVYGSGFPKSLNIGKSVNKLETDEWSKISKALDNIDQKSIMEVWKSNAKPVGIQLSKSLTEVGNNTPKNFFVPDIAVLYHRAKVEVAYAPVFIAELSSKGLTPLSEESGIIVQESADTSTIQLQNRAKFAVKLSPSHEVFQWSIFTAQCDVKEWLKENTAVNHKVDEALKTLRGNKKYSNEEITNVLCAVLTDILKLTILNQSKTFQNLDTKSQMDYASVINVIITEYTAENLISNTVDILKSKAVDKLQGNEREEYNPGGRYNYSFQEGNSQFVSETATKSGKRMSILPTKGNSPYEGWGTALKPAHEPIVLARKPLSEKTVAENVLKWGTGGINIDECRVGTSGGTKKIDTENCTESLGRYGDGLNGGKVSQIDMGRFPANFIHDGSDEVVSMFPNVKTGSIKPYISKDEGMFGMMKGKEHYNSHTGDSGSASRFFKTCNDTQKNTIWEDSEIALKPAHEPIVLARKPLSEKTVAENVLKWGTGGINIDGCRVEASGKDLEKLNNEWDREWNTNYKTYAESVGGKAGFDMSNSKTENKGLTGRFPANFIHDGSDEVVSMFPETKGGGSQNGSRKWKGEEGNGGYGGWAGKVSTDNYISRDNGKGSASRFFYTAKASKSERNAGLDGFEVKQTIGGGGGVGNYLDDVNSASGKYGSEKAPNKNHHPTIKPISLMRYLTRLITPKGGIVLDPYMGSGTTGIACKLEGFNFIGIEIDKEYYEIAKARIENAK